MISSPYFARVGWNFGVRIARCEAVFIPAVEPPGEFESLVGLVIPHDAVLAFDCDQLTHMGGEESQEVHLDLTSLVRYLLRRARNEGGDREGNKGMHRTTFSLGSKLEKLCQPGMVLDCQDFFGI